MSVAGRRRLASRGCGLDRPRFSPAPGRAETGAARVGEIQRSRLLRAAAEVMDRCGYGGASVARIAERARVSRRTFYEMFENRDDCLLAMLDGTIEQVKRELAHADQAQNSWRERVRAGLWTVLCFLDREPSLARVLLVESRCASRSVLRWRQQVLTDLAKVVDDGRREGEGEDLAALGVLGGVCEVLHSRLLEAEPGPLRGLLPELTALVVLPYLGPGAARRELTRALPELDEGLRGSGGDGGDRGGLELAAAPPMRLTYRTARVLEALDERPGQSNRQIADRAGIADQGQMSKLLGRLERLGLVENGSSGGHEKGVPNQWSLTPAGIQVTRPLGRGVEQEQVAA